MAIHHSNVFFQLSIFFSSLRIVMKSSWLIPLFINASDILLSMLFNLLLGSITTLLCFCLLFLIVFKNFFTNPVAIENPRLKLALIIPTGAPIAAANDAIEMLPVASDKTINDLSKYSKKAKYLLYLCLYCLFCLCI